MRLGGLGLSNPCHEAAREHASSIQVTSPLVEHIVAQTHQLPDESLIESGRQAVKRGKAEELSGIAANLKQIVPRKTKRALELAQEKGSSVFTTTGGMGKECIRYHSRLAELIAAKKGEQYSQTISWIRARTSFALLRSFLVCLRGSRVKRRAPFDYNNCDIEIAAAEGVIDIV